MSNLKRNVNLDLRLGKRRVRINRAESILGPILAAPIIILSALMVPFILLFGLVLVVVGLLKPVIVIAGAVVTIFGIANLVSTGHGWLTVFIGIAMIVIAKNTKVTVK